MRGHRIDDRERSVSATGWAGLDGLAQRAASSVMTLVLAALTDPSAVGTYTTVVIVLSLYQVGFDLPLRQASFRALGTVDGDEVVRRILLRGSYLATVLLCGLLTVFVTSGKMQAGAGASMLPLCAVPLASALGALSVVALQKSGQWRAVAVIRLSSLLLSLAVTVPLVAATRNLAFAAIQLPLAELIVSMLSRWRSVGRSPLSGSSGGPIQRLVWQNGIYQAIGWFRVQVDRLVLIVVGSATSLGLYSLAFAASRLLLEAPLGTMLNVLRSDLARSAYDDISVGREITQHFSIRLQMMGVGLCAVVVVIAWPVLALLLAPEWDDALDLVPILIISVFSTVQSWTLGTAASHFGFVSRGYASQAAGIVLGVVVGVLLFWNLQAGCWMFVAREIVVAAIASASYRQLVMSRALIWWAVPTLLGAALVLILI